MVTIQSSLNDSSTFKSFFGNLTLEPGINTNVDDRLWRNCKNNNPDVQLLLKKGVLVEVETSAGGTIVE
jgi:hypothetical protein